MWAVWAPIALYTKSQAVQALLTSSSFPAGTRSAADEGLNIPKQDIPDISLKTSNILLLIAKLSP